MLEWISVVTPYLFAFFVIYGALSDLSTFRIPNWVSYGLALLFILHVLPAWAGSAVNPAITSSIVAALLVFAVAVVFWRFGLVGGGDVKFLTAISLWIGTSLLLPFFLLLTLFALLFAALLSLLLSKREKLTSGRNSPEFLKKILGKIAERRLPYGFPIGLAALVLVPWLFST